MTDFECKKCGAPLPDEKFQFCKDCLLGNTKFRFNFSNIPSLILNHPDKLLLFIGSILVAFFLMRPAWLLGYTKLPQIKTLEAVAPARNDPCLNAFYCVVVYMAPWCGACQAELGWVGELAVAASRTKGIRVLIVIGADERNNLMRMAQQVRAGAFLDTQQIYRNALGVRAFPSFFVVNHERQILRRVSPSYELDDTSAGKLKSFVALNLPDDAKNQL